MGREHFDVRTRTFASDTTRRGVLVGFTSGVLALLSLAFDDADVAGKRKKKKKKKRQSPTSPPPSPPSSPPPPPPGPPVTLPDAQCPLAGSTAATFGRRVAQTFLAQHSGQLTSAWVVLFSNQAGANFDFEIFAVDQTDLPTTSLCPPVSINDVPATVSGSRTLTATFAFPASVVAGQRYALVVTSSLDTHNFHVHNNNACATGQVWRDEDLDGDYAQEPNRDLVFATFVTA